MGADFRVSRQRGQIHPGPGGTVITATVHPSSVLRAPTGAQRAAARAAFHADLELAAVLVRQGPVAAVERSTKRQLLAIARSLDVAGRSTMDKAGLVSAVAEAFA